jgi:hypothetical protein
MTELASFNPAGRTGFATAHDWAVFLKPLLLAVAQPPSARDFGARVAAIAFALNEVPVDLLTEWRQREAMARFKFFPVPAELAEWLAPAIADRRDSRARRLALAAAVPQLRPDHSAEEVAQVRAASQAFLRDMASRIGEERGAVQPKYLTGEARKQALAKVGVTLVERAAE